MTPWTFVRDCAVLALAVLCGVAIAACLALRAWPDPPRVPESEPQVVRMLDVVVRDSNTTNHRQRFECRPVRRKAP